MTIKINYNEDSWILITDFAGVSFANNKISVNLKLDSTVEDHVITSEEYMEEPSALLRMDFINFESFAIS